ncbi:hypothetical protein AFK68_06255 [Hydrocoleum sp. CS-953]|uniref:hypothetical protein n=1 Tax=Hydrocoleum sp. CS-953 TaxID=1671698 RepID=UPI000B9C6A00|nr:hypothetical protein [Hydrocoleum sp. CS-953]OZH55178.1 hypothetical protein AFK68_06255 [Hydrocoleum sp. CS-953]
MVNELREGDNLISVNYDSLLEKILKKLPEQNLFKISTDRRRLLINIDEVAASIATTNIQNPLSTTKGVRIASINFVNREKFLTQIREIKDYLITNLESTEGIGDIDSFVDSLIVNLTYFQGRASKLGLSYPFNESYTDLQKQELILDSQLPGSNSLLKFHKLTITVGNITAFQSQLKTGIKRSIQNNFDSEDPEDIEDIYHLLERKIEDRNSDFNQLQRLVDEETLGKLKKEAKIIYLEHLLENIETNDKPGVIYLRDLIRRLKLIEQYINDESKADGYYDVYYGGESFNYRDIFARAEVFDALPIIPIIDGNLGETTNRETGETQFVLGLKMKLDGKVQARGGKEVFDYNLEIITHNNSEENEALKANPEKKKTWARKILTRAFLYYFVFSCPNPNGKNYHSDDELNYKPIPKFDENVLPVLKGDNDDEKDKIFRGLIEGFKKYGVKQKIEKLRGLVRNFLDRGKKLPNCIERREICINKRIIKTDDDSLFQGNFFHDDLRENYKKCLRYIFLVEEGVSNRAVCQLPASIKIEDIRYFEGSDRQSFQWEYDVEGIKTLPVMWIPDTDTCRRIYHENFVQKGYKFMLFSYNNERLKSGKNQLNSTQAFIYRFTWILLSYLCLLILLEQYSGEEKELFIPMVRLHEGTHENPFPAEKFLANLAKTLAFIFSKKYRCNSQGFRVSNSYIRNGLNSLYSVLPKKFSFNHNSDSTLLDKLAIIIVSSKLSDSRTGSQNRKDRIANLFGEVITIQRLENGSVKIQPLTKFFDNYQLRKMYEEPPVLMDKISELCLEGYQHFLYVAQAPYTSKLHITQQEEEERLYFMSPTIINTMKQNRDDIKIYPVLFDKYYVRKLEKNKKIGVKSLYIQDTRQLMNLAEDSSQKSVVFFNLFNGISVGREAERFYNGVISYSTLLGKYYSGVMDDEDIRQGLVYDSSLKNDILQYLTFFHFSRFEKQEKDSSNLSLKLDPYENIIGDEALGSLAIFPQMTESIEFNALAFLTEVNDAVDGVVF